MIMNSAPISKPLASRSSILFAPRTGADGMARQGLTRLVAFWIERHRQRKALAKLDNRLLDDVGIARSQAAREIAKPFWR